MAVFYRAEVPALREGSKMKRNSKFGTRRQWRKARKRRKQAKASLRAMRASLYPHQRDLFDVVMRGDKLSLFGMRTGRWPNSLPNMQPSRFHRLNAAERLPTIHVVDYSKIEARILADLSRKQDSS